MGQAHPVGRDRHRGAVFAQRGPYAAQGVGEVALDLQACGDVGAGQAQFSGAGQYVTQGVAVAYRRPRRVRRSVFAAVPKAQPYR